MTPDSDKSDPMRASVASVAAAGERLRMELLDALRRTERTENAGVRTELVMFYGQAFDNVRRALPSPVPGDLPAAKALHECVCGLAIHRVWLISDTPLDAREDLERMTDHWRAVTRMLLRVDGE